MAVKHSFTSVSDPSDITIYGEGSFLVGFWGETIKYSKNGKLWYEHPKQYEWVKGNYYEADSFDLNDNDKTITFGNSPIFLSNVTIEWNNTATVGDRKYVIQSLGTNTTSHFYIGSGTANEVTNIHFNNYIDVDLTGQRQNDVQAPKFWDENIPFFNSIVVKDSPDIDDNDDIFISIRGVYALPKYHWIKFKNCKSFQVQTVTESLSDGVFTVGSSLPRSLKVLKV